MRWVVVAALIAGCGRLGFELRSDSGGDAVGDGPAMACGPWSAPVELTDLNTVANDFGPTLRDDGLELFWHTQRGGGPGEADFWSTTRFSTADTFFGGAPVPGINSPLSDENCALAPEGTSLYLTSKRDGPFQLFRTNRTTVTSPFSTPLLVTELSTLDLRGPELDRTGTVLLFTNGSTLRIGHAVLSVAVFGYRGDVAGLGDDSRQPSLSADGLTIYYVGSRGTDAMTDILMATRPTPDAPFSGETIVDAVSEPGIHETDPEITPDGETLYFASVRPNGTGLSDLYKATRDCP